MKNLNLFLNSVIKLKKIKDTKQEIQANKVEFVTEKSKPKNEIGINLKIENCSSGEKSIKKFFVKF